MSVVTGILLAAGESSRFGEDKLLYELTLAGKRRPLIQHTLLPWLSVFDELSVVVSTDKPKLRQILVDFVALQHKNVQVIECNDAVLGMGHSLAAAIKANLHAEGWVIGLADMPLIPGYILSEVQQNLLLGAQITAPYFDGRRGHPVGFNRCYKDQLLALKGDSGAKHLLQRNAEIIQKVETTDQGVLVDIDVKNDVGQIEKIQT